MPSRGERHPERHAPAFQRRRRCTWPARRPRSRRSPLSPPAVALFAPNPLLTVTLEVEGDERQSIHFHAGGQGVWVAGMAAAMGATPVLCGLIGGEPGELLRAAPREGRRR